MSHGIKTKIGLVKATKRSKGFTLIELMITVAIVGILAAVAIPAYQNYTIRAQVSEGLTLSEGVKASVEEYYANNGVFPNSLSDINLHQFPEGKYADISVSNNGEVLAIYGNPNISSSTPNNVNANIKMTVLSLVPTDDGNGNIHWACGTSDTTVKKKYLPTSCTNS